MSIDSRGSRAAGSLKEAVSGVELSLEGAKRTSSVRQIRTRAATVIASVLIGLVGIGGITYAFASLRNPSQAAPLPPGAPISTGNVSHLGLAWTARMSEAFGARSYTTAGGGFLIREGWLPGGKGVTLAAYPQDCGEHASVCSPSWSSTFSYYATFLPPVISGRDVVSVHDINTGPPPGGGLGGSTEVSVFSLNCGSGGATCHPVWTYEIPNEMAQAVQVSGSHIFVAASSGRAGDEFSGVYAFPIGCGSTTCNPLWMSPIPSSPSAFGVSMAVDSGTLFVSGSTGHLLAVPVDCQPQSSGRPIPVCAPSWRGTQGTGAGVLGAAGGTVYDQTSPTAIYAYRSGGCGRPSCAPIWSATFPSGFGARIVLPNGLLMVGCTRVNCYYGGSGKSLFFPSSCRSDGGMCQEPTRLQDLPFNPFWLSVSGDVGFVGGFGGLRAFDLGCLTTATRCPALWIGADRGYVVGLASSASHLFALSPSFQQPGSIYGFDLASGPLSRPLTLAPVPPKPRGLPVAALLAVAVLALLLLGARARRGRTDALQVLAVATCLFAAASPLLPWVSYADGIRLDLFGHGPLNQNVGFYALLPIPLFVPWAVFSLGALAALLSSRGRRARSIALLAVVTLAAWGVVVLAAVWIRHGNLLQNYLSVHVSFGPWVLAGTSTLAALAIWGGRWRDRAAGVDASLRDENTS